ncbi:MAG: DUF4339 domain-containing protein [Rhodopirellula sp.]|nr:DUF4339 domain-containing protein [Rhodopirellula sp.]
MNPIEWFYAKDNKRLGPVSPAELKQLVVRGELTGGDLVWRQGMSDWTPARRVKGLFDKAADPAAAIDGTSSSVGPRAVSAWSAVYRRMRGGASHHVFDDLLDFARSHFTTQFVETTSRLFAACGCYGLYAALVLLIVYAVAAGLAGAGAARVLPAVIAIPALIVLQYVAGRFLEELERLNRVTPGRLTSSAVPDCFALLSFFVGATSLLGLTILAVQTEQFHWIIPALAVFILCQYMAAIAINLETLYITITTTAVAGEEALSIVSFFLKLQLRMVPVAFGVGVVSGTAKLAFAALEVILRSKETSLPVVLNAWLAAISPFGLLFGAAILPLVVYWFFLFQHLIIDILRGIISLSNLAEQRPAETESERS